MRRVVVFLALVALAVALLLVLRERGRAFIAAQVELLQSDDREEAEEARKRLQRVGRSAVRPVCALLEHEDQQVRARAALTLANIGHAAACGPLMEASKRGDFPAAHALEFMEHPRTEEAFAWVNCRQGDWAVAELQRRCPVGCRMPTAPWVWFRDGGRLFGPTWKWRIHWPCQVGESREGGEVNEDAWRWMPYACSEADCSYSLSVLAQPLPEAWIGRARLRELCGDYAEAAEFYGRALELAPKSAVAQIGRKRAQGLVSLAGRMERLLPSGYQVGRILSHPTWRRGGATHYLGVISWLHESRSVLSMAPKLAVFVQQGERLTRTHTTATFDAQELPHVWSRWDGPNTYVGMVVHKDGRPAEPVVIRAYRPRGMLALLGLSYDVFLYRLANGKMVKTLALPSAVMPWVADLDDDREAEIITFRHVSMAVPPRKPAPWPIVHTRVNGEYEARSGQFPSVFAVVAPILLAREREAPMDPRIPHCLGRAHEIIGKKGLAIAAYKRAEEKYRQTAERMQKKGEAEQAHLHREAAAAVKEHRLRLEAELTASSGP